MGLLDQILGGSRGGMTGGPDSRGNGVGSGILMALLPVVIGMLSHRGGGAGTTGGLGGLGGLRSLIERFTHAGYGAQASSWIGTGPNEPLSREAVTDVFGDDRISEIAQQAGVSTDDARHGLSELLPGMVDHFTPQGELPDLEHMSSSVDDFIGRMDS